MRLELVKKGDVEARARLEAMGLRAGDARPLWDEIAPILLGAERRKFARGFTKSIIIGQRLTLRRFSRSGAAGEVHTINIRRRSRYSLVDTGRLRDSLTIFRAPGQQLDAQPDELKFGTHVFYARFLRKRGFRLVTLDKAARADISDKVSAYLTGDTLVRFPGLRGDL